MQGSIKSMLRNRITAFSLVEVIIALIISSLGLLLINGGVYGIHRQLNSNSGSKERIQWEKLVSTFESEQMRFQWKENQEDGTPVLYCQTQRNNYLLKKNRRNLILQGTNGQGFMPLMMNIDEFRYRYSEPFLEIWVKVHGHQYYRKVVMQRKNNEK